MFRRFMIACWVLFALTGVTSAIGWSVNTYSYDRIMDIGESDGVIAEDLDRDWSDPATIENRLKAMEFLSYHRLKAFGFEEVPSDDEVSDSDWQEIIDINTGRNLGEVVDDLESTTKRLRAVQRYRDRQQIGASALLIAGLSALVLLLWNIIWHTSHWIWMGRKVD